MPSNTLQTRPAAELWQTAVDQGKSVASAATDQARKHRVELFILAGTLTFVLIVLLIALAALPI